MEFIVSDALKASASSVAEEYNIGNANIKVIGCGGGGNNSVDWLYKKGVTGAEVIAINTDKLHLDHREADKKILIGKEVTRGLGAGGVPSKGLEAAKESASQIREAIKGADMVFVCTGLGGGTDRKSTRLNSSHSQIS